MTQKPIGILPLNKNTSWKENPNVKTRPQDTKLDKTTKTSALNSGDVRGFDAIES